MFVSAIGCLFLYKQLSGVHRLLFYYIGITALLNFLSYFFRETITYNLFMVPISGLVTLFIFSWLYLYHLLPSTTHWLRGVVWSIQILIWGWFLWSIEDTLVAQQFDASIVAVAYFIIVVLSLRYYWCMLTQQLPLRHIHHILNGMVLAYFLVSTVFFMTSNFLVNEALYLVAPFWMVYGISTLSFYSYLTYYIWRHGRHNASKTFF